MLWFVEVSPRYPARQLGTRISPLGLCDMGLYLVPRNWGGGGLMGSKYTKTIYVNGYKALGMPSQPKLAEAIVAFPETPALVMLAALNTRCHAGMGQEQAKTTCQ